MDLTDLQVELRRIEKQLAFLHDEIETMKPKSEVEKKADFESIDSLAKRHTIFREEIDGMSYETKKAFFKSLSFILLAAEKDIYARLLYMTRLCRGCGLDWKSEDIYKAGFKIKDFDSVVKGMEKNYISFLVEAFITSFIHMPVDEKTLYIIADIASIIGYSLRELEVIATVAKCNLVGDMDLLGEILDFGTLVFIKKDGFRDYIPHEWIAKYEDKQFHSIFGNLFGSSTSDSISDSDSIRIEIRKR